MSKFAEAETRDRILAYLTMLQSALALNPGAALSSIARLCGIGHAIAAQLIDLGVISALPEGAGHKWESAQTPGEIADLVIVHRRKQSAPAAAAVDLGPVREAVGTLATQVATLTEQMNALLKAASAPAKLSADDAELLRLAVQDNNNNAARITQLEKTVGEMLYRERSITGANAGMIKTETQRRWKIALLGLHERDVRHVSDGLNAALGPNVGRAIELTLLNHLAHTVSIPAGTDAVVSTPDGHQRATEVARIWSGPHARASGGIKSVVGEITRLVNPARA